MSIKCVLKLVNMELKDASYEQVRGWLAALFTQIMNMRIGIGLSYF